MMGIAGEALQAVCLLDLSETLYDCLVVDGCGHRFRCMIILALCANHYLVMDGQSQIAPQYLSQ